MATLKNDKITQADMHAALMQARVMLGSQGEFSRSARADFDDARDYRDHIADSANDLRKVLTRQAGADTRETRADAARLVALAEAINALACLQCNGVMRREADGRSFASWNEADEKQEESTRRDIVQAMNAILLHYGARVAASYGDPRGAVVHIQFADGASNRGGRETVWGL